MVERRSEVRGEKTRSVVVRSFYLLLGTRRYEDLQIKEIVRKASVGRSTFYEHFKNKRQLLERSLNGVMSVLADAATDGGNDGSLERTLEHFWEVRHLVRGILIGSAEPIVFNCLSSLIEDRLKLSCQHRNIQLRIPTQLAAAQLAGSQLGIIRAWLISESACSSDAICAAVRRSSKCIVDALVNLPQMS
jgi:AcrR family transcriptional regulator